jgi:nitric oxide dioxygenase
VISQSALSTVRETLPVVGAAIGDITPIFYKRMFTARPDLLRDLFNRGNQAQGEQQKALAGAIAAYASLLVSDDAPNIDAMMSRIANKHASLGITEDQYPIVYEHLFAAIGEVLGDAATPEVVDAWTEVYWDMADALIKAEKELYARHDVAPGDVWRDLVVTRRRQESPNTVSLVLSRPDGGVLPQAQPGQYVSVQVELPDGANQIRQYSLTKATARTSWTVTIKAEPGRAEAGIPAGEVSNFIHGNVFEGDTIRCSLPYGDLVVEDSEAPLLLVSAGIGCTPILGALNDLVSKESRRPVTVLHADQSMAAHAHRSEMAQLVRPAARCEHAPLVRAARCPSRHRDGPRRLHQPRRGARRRQCAGLPVRPAAFHEGGSPRPRRTRRAGDEHPLRSLRPRYLGHRARGSPGLIGPAA